MLLRRKAVPDEVPAGDLIGRRRGLHGDDPTRPPAGGIDGKGPGVGKAVQDRRRPAEGADDLPVETLIEEESRLLPGEQIDLEAQAVFPDLHRLRDIPGRGTDPVGKPLQLPGAPLAPFVDPDRRQDLQQKSDHGLAPFLHPRRPDGHDQIAAVPVDRRDRASRPPPR